MTGKKEQPKFLKFLKYILIMQTLLVMIIKFYQFFSPFLGKNCRFYPTCSKYAKDAIITYGSFKGSALAIYRILRCQPFCEGGFDPITKEDSNF